MTKRFYQHLENEIQSIKANGLYKSERIIASPQDAEITLENGDNVINFCANNYLGFANHPLLVKTAQAHIEKYGYGMSSVRFICGTQTTHRELELKLSKFFKTEDTIVYASCFDANAGVFESLLTAEDAIIRRV
jgi:glycine C-acetyltransferase